MFLTQYNCVTFWRRVIWRNIYANKRFEGIVHFSAENLKLYFQGYLRKLISYIGKQAAAYKQNQYIYEL